MKIKKSMLLILLASAAFLTGCNGDSEKSIQGSWKSGEIVPLEQKNSTFVYAPTSTTLKISEKYIQLMDSKPLEQKLSGSGDDVKITIAKESLFANFPEFERMLSVGSLKEGEVKSLQQIECSLKDSATMECNLAEFWTASTYRSSTGKVKRKKNTYSENRYTKKGVLFTRMAGEKGE